MLGKIHIMEITPGTSRVKEEPSDDHKTSHDINLVKLEALAEGKFTDCVFLVGPEDGKKEEVHALKGVMMMASSFMEGLFRSPFCPQSPIRIKDVDPKIFKLIVEFVLLSQLKTEVNCEDLLDLLIAADLYLIDSLKVLCVNMLERDITVSEIWVTLQKLLKIDNIKSEADNICVPLLTKKTQECLEHETFLTATSESVSFLLQQDTLDLKSENELVNYCLNWAQHQKDLRESFRNVFGQLRLLTLTMEQLADLPPDFFTPMELQALFQFNLNKLDLSNLPSSLCSNLKPRQFRPLKLKRVCQSGKHHEYSTELIPRNMMKSCLDLQRNEEYRTNASFTNILYITSKVDLYLTRIDLVGQIQDRSQIIYDKSLKGFVSKPNKEDYLLHVLVSNGDMQSCPAKSIKPFDKISVLILTNPVFLPKGETATIKFQFVIEDSSTFRNILCKDVNAFVLKNLDTEVFESIQVEVSDNEPIVIKEIKYVLVN